MAAKLEEWAEKYAKLVQESTNNMRASERKAQGLLAIVRCVCSQMEGHSEGQRIEYAARLMRFSEEAFKQAQELAELVKDREAHRGHHAALCWNLLRGPVEQKLSDEQFAQVKKGVEEKIERSMQADLEKLGIEVSNSIPDEVLNQAFELLGVTREQVVQQVRC